MGQQVCGVSKDKTLAKATELVYNINCGKVNTIRPET
jgi:hypothetical protein